MPNFQVNPILNSPYHAPQRHWEVDNNGEPTGIPLPGRRPSRFFVPVPAATRRRRQQAMELDLAANVAAEEEAFSDNANINFVREQVAKWRAKPIEKRGVTSVTQRLLRHWQSDAVQPRLFFCQMEALETMIWLHEVAPKIQDADVQDVLKQIREGGAGLPRVAAKMATGSGKTMVMAMLIAYHAANTARFPRQNFCGAFLLVCPGITIRDRLRVLQPADPDNYYEQRHIVPRDMLGDVRRAEVVITNYHAFELKKKKGLTARQRQLLRGNDKPAAPECENEGEMLQRVCGGLLRRGQRVAVINDEAHHCYKEKEGKPQERAASSDEEKEEARNNKKAARMWIRGIEMLSLTAQVQAVYDLSATPFFLRGSGYPEGTLFPWVVSDFSLMDAIESGIVKLPGVPVDDDAAQEGQMPVFRNLYQHIGGGLGKTQSPDPTRIPEALETALMSLYEHYQGIYAQWEDSQMGVPPVFIVVCNNTITSKKVFEHIAGYRLPAAQDVHEDGSGTWQRGAYSLFNNVREDGKGMRPRLHTLLFDSRRLESGEGLSPDFRAAAAAEIDAFRRERMARQEASAADDITEEDLLREALNTVGKKGRLGEQIRCVVSVSMLTEGWDANNVTHILGVRPFGTQLLCEQVVGRALRRQNYTLATEADARQDPRLTAGHFRPENAYVVGVPFAFMPADPPPPPPPPQKQTHVCALRERGGQEIVFPKVRGYWQRPSPRPIAPDWSRIEPFDLEPIAPTEIVIEPIVGVRTVLSLDALRRRGLTETAWRIAHRVAWEKYRPAEGGALAPDRFSELVAICRHWLDPANGLVRYRNGAYPQYFLVQQILHKAAERVSAACPPAPPNKDAANQNWRLLPVLSDYDRAGSTRYVNFSTPKKRLHQTAPHKCHLNFAVCDSDWETGFCRALEAMPAVHSYVRNDRLNFRVPYEHDGAVHDYLPDFIVRLDDGRGKGDLLNLIVEIKGWRSAEDEAKAAAMRNDWIPAVNNQGEWGRWAFFGEIREDTRALMDNWHLNPATSPVQALMQEFIAAGEATRAARK